VSVQAYNDLPPARKIALREMSKVNLAAAIVLGGEAGFTKECAIASAFSVCLSTLAAMGVSKAAIVALVNDVIPSPAKKTKVPK
jgi:hypothetical protein